MGDRRMPFTLAGQKQTLRDFLDYLRESIIIKARGLDDEQVRRRIVSSDTTLLWLVKHMTAVEIGWFQCPLLGLMSTGPTMW
jgi:hypothetical protein